VHSTSYIGLKQRDNQCCEKGITKIAQTLPTSLQAHPIGLDNGYFGPMQQ
jgi:hypothetical protein